MKYLIKGILEREKKIVRIPFFKQLRDDTTWLSKVCSILIIFVCVILSFLSISRGTIQNVGELEF